MPLLSTCFTCIHFKSGTFYYWLLRARCPQATICGGLIMCQALCWRPLLPSFSLPLHFLDLLIAQRITGTPAVRQALWHRAEWNAVPVAAELLQPKRLFLSYCPPLRLFPPILRVTEKPPLSALSSLALLVAWEEPPCPVWPSCHTKHRCQHGAPA